MNLMQVPRRSRPAAIRNTPAIEVARITPSTPRRSAVSENQHDERAGGSADLKPAAAEQKPPITAAWRAPECRCLKSRRVAMRGDDLVGGAAGDLGHAVELPGETAGARRCRPQLHDQLADLCFRHHGADAIPSRPAL